MSKKTITCGMILCFLATLNITVAGSDNTNDELDELIRDVQLLRKAVESLEMRVERLEQDRASATGMRKNDGLKSPSCDMPMTLDEWQRHEMPWKPTYPTRDTGLYVFPPSGTVDQHRLDRN